MLGVKKTWAPAKLITLQEIQQSKTNFTFDNLQNAVDSAKEGYFVLFTTSKPFEHDAKVTVKIGPKVHLLSFGLH
jgi:hypothetical protein